MSKDQLFIFLYAFSWLLLIAGVLLLFGSPLAWVFGYVAGLIAVKGLVLALVTIVLAFCGFGLLNAEFLWDS